MKKLKAIIFIDGNNWYHNVKNIVKPSDTDIRKIANLICNANKYALEEIRWYVSTPSIKDGEARYYRYMSFFISFRKTRD